MAKWSKSRRIRHLFGIAEYRSGRPITLAGQPVRLRRAELLPAPRRDAMIDATIAILDRWHASKFQFEGACRHGVRAGLCLDGFSYGAADQWSAAIVGEALRRIGAVRPSWQEGQPEHTQDGYAPVERVTCEHCGRLLTDKTRPWQRFCSKVCRVAAKERRIKTQQDLCSAAERKAILAASRQAMRDAAELRNTKACAHCGVIFRADRPRVMFCSKRCVSASLALPEKPCTHCGRMFQPDAWYRKFCSPDCSHAATRKPPKVVATKTCAWCGTEFTPKDRRQMYCTKKCTKAASRVPAALRAPALNRDVQAAPPNDDTARIKPAFICEAAE